MADSLLDVGTRFAHWNELLDTFRQGVQVVDNMSFPSDADKEMKASLETAIKMIERRMSNVAGLNSNFIPDWKMREVWAVKAEGENEPAIPNNN